MKTNPASTSLGALLVLAVLGLASLGQVMAAEPPAGEPSVYKRVAGRELKLFIVKPDDWKAADQRPAIVFFHGGGWVGGAPTQFNQPSRYLAARGMVCVQVEYRLLESKTTEPPLVCVQDAKSAMRWVRAHAPELGIDPQRIAAGGSSAGGHLAAFVGLVDGVDDPQDDLKVSPKANALVLFNPVLDNGPDDGYGRARVGDRFQEFSPAHNVTAAAPPAIVFLGTQDRLIPVKVIERFQANMKKAGSRCDTRFYEGQGHAFWGREPFRSRTLIETDKFLGSLGWLKGAPTLKEPANAPAKPTAAKTKQ
jgi:acetyl esterase